ncbi:Cytochrome P450 [Klebsormidium nitens]|uniref:Cytochrome P450 n=1 Tax=Klebsormidium nitens TaxID=105231 RepID=A0A1Y1IDE1_KLENI|nr:Cytochrome P450 [Klebsormidium nitens]|eukprot:GAQ88940.1 Cytochrome P450 [Klebsormidium nitens]
MDQATMSMRFPHSLSRYDLLHSSSWSPTADQVISAIRSHWLSFSFLATLVALLLHAYLTFFHRPLRLIRHFQKQGIRGPPFRPILGHMPEVLAGIKETAQTGVVFPNLLKWREMYGDVFYYLMGTQVRLAIMTPELGHKIQTATSGPKGTFQKDAHTRQAYEPLLGSYGLVLAANDVWARQRKLANPMFYHSKIKDMFPIMAECSQELIRKWGDKIDTAGGGKVEIEVWAEFGALARDILCGAVFGDPRGATAAYTGQDIYGDFGQLMKDMIAQLLSLGPKLIPGFKYIPTERNRRIAALRARVHGMLNSIIENRRQAGAKAAAAHDGHAEYGDDLLGRLLAATDEEGKLSSVELMDQCKTFFFAGHETTATAMAWSLALLAQHPEWQDRARAEIRSVCGKNAPDLSMLAELKVVNIIFSETLRLFPPLFLASRQTVTPTTLDGVHIPKDPNLVVVLPVVNYHRDPAVWGDDAAEFRPERFADGVNKAGVNEDELAAARAYMPFTAGPRTCIGQGFALQEGKLVLATLLQNFSFSFAPGYKHSVNVGVTLTPKYGVPMIVERV